MWFGSSAVRVAYSDASDAGYGGYIVELGPHVAAQGTWSEIEVAQSSTMRELIAVRNVLQSFSSRKMVYRKSERRQNTGGGQ